MAAILNFSKTLKKIGVDLWRPFWILVASQKKSLAHPHVARNVMFKLQKKKDQTIFLCFFKPPPPKKN